jgi:hypothetical protein
VSEGQDVIYPVGISRVILMQQTATILTATVRAREDKAAQGYGNVWTSHDDQTSARVRCLTRRAPAFNKIIRI